jgi:hypothetical protein
VTFVGGGGVGLWGDNRRWALIFLRQDKLPHLSDPRAGAQGPPRKKTS